MTARRSPAAPSLEKIYNRHGDTRPSRAFLEKTLKYMYATGRPDMILAAAHVSIDLAFVDPDGAERHLGRSKELLDDIVDTTEAYAQYGKDIGKSRSIVTTAAVLHAADLPTWQAAVGSVEPPMDYLEKLKAADAALHYAQNDEQAGEKILEFIPQLLGARGLDRETLGWNGRLALNRENFRTWEDHTINPNWDSGMCLSGTAQTIDNPLRVQVKRNPLHGAGRSTASYNRAGVAVVYAAQTGFEDPFQIVDSCLNEAQLLENADPTVRLLSTEQLDNVTSRIHAQATRILSNPS